MNHGFFMRQLQRLPLEETVDITEIRCWRCRYLARTGLQPKTYMCQTHPVRHFARLFSQVPKKTAESLENCKDFESKEKQK